MPIREYLYVDSSRLNFYVDQLGLPEKRQKIPKWTAKLGLLPEVTASQEEQFRERTTHDKIEQLLQILRERELLGDGRFEGREVFLPDARLFRLETTEATKIFLPPLQPEDALEALHLGDGDELGMSVGARSERFRREGRQRRYEREIERVRNRLAGFRGITLWFSDRLIAPDSPTTSSGQLFLVIGFHKDDTDGFGSWSAYSALAGLFRDLESDLRKSVLHRVSQHDLQYPEESSLQEAFLQDPLEWLGSIGADLGPGRCIQSLYRVRDAILYHDPRDSKESIATVAYPVFVAASGM